MKKRVRSSKFDPLVEEVTLLEANPNYAHVQLPSGKETTVPLKDLAPCGETSMQGSLGVESNIPMISPLPKIRAVPISTPEKNKCEKRTEESKEGQLQVETDETQKPAEEKEETNSSTRHTHERVLRRSERAKRPPDRYVPK